MTDTMEKKEEVQARAPVVMTETDMEEEEVGVSVTTTDGRTSGTENTAMKDNDSTDVISPGLKNISASS